jgi:FKBP-type peptidyl-prolyl cis-trans isomerase
MCLPAFAGCGGITSSDRQDVVFEVIEDVTFAPGLDIDLSLMEKLPSGVYILDRVVGTGESLAYGNNADVNYRGWLRTGTLFDQGTTSFLMGNGTVIPGFEQGVLGMKAGGTRLLIIPPILAWGERGAPGIPPGAIVIFEVELLGVS